MADGCALAPAAALAGGPAILTVGASSTPRAQRLEFGAPLALALAALLAFAAALGPPMVGLLVFGLITPTQPTTLTILSQNGYGVGAGPSDSLQSWRGYNEVRGRHPRQSSPV